LSDAFEHNLVGDACEYNLVGDSCEHELFEWRMWT
jgi:hypothetical protein